MQRPVSGSSYIQYDPINIDLVVLMVTCRSNGYYHSPCHRFIVQAPVLISLFYPIVFNISICTSLTCTREQTSKFTAQNILST